MKIAFSAVPATVTAITAYCGGDGGISRAHAINRIITRHAEIMRCTILPAFDDRVWQLLRDALNGALYDPAETIHHLPDDIEDAIRMDGLDAKWGVDGPALVTDLRGMTYTQKVALIEAVEIWWAGHR